MIDNVHRRNKMAANLIRKGDPEDEAELGISRVGFVPNQAALAEIIQTAHDMMAKKRERTERGHAMFKASKKWLARYAREASPGEREGEALPN